ncbi:MAG: hypothetical protein E4H02_08195 [Lentisphaerales bacterium]|nr:MAG: hypothetical protein E4H02_08195 [Lentisphaerales bacterium]
MFSKAEIEACLAGEPTPVVPAHLFWFDGKFVDANRTEVERMHEQYTDDFLQAHELRQAIAALRAPHACGLCEAFAQMRLEEK